MIRETARCSHEEQAVVGWLQGRMEWGPRSLGSRSSSPTRATARTGSAST